jgi:hypothetical protein
VSYRDGTTRFDDELRTRLVAARSKPRFGYGRPHALLGRSGEHVNHMRAEKFTARLCTEITVIVECVGWQSTIRSPSSCPNGEAEFAVASTNCLTGSTTMSSRSAFGAFAASSCASSCVRQASGDV